MKKVKELYKKHETKILITGGIVLLVDVDDVKKVVELNADISDSLYAIVKERGTKYALVILNESPVNLG